MTAHVVEDGSFTCIHQGRRGLSGLSPARAPLTVGGSPVVLAGAAGGDAEYTGCGFSDNTGSHKCASTTITTAGAHRLTVGGKPVLLGSDTVTATNPKAGPATATVTTGQSRLRAT